MVMKTRKASLEKKETENFLGAKRAFQGPKHWPLM